VKKTTHIAHLQIAGTPAGVSISLQSEPIG